MIGSHCLRPINLLNPTLTTTAITPNDLNLSTGRRSTMYVFCVIVSRRKQIKYDQYCLENARMAELTEWMCGTV